jgi:release factor glutamine methyltransferase
VILQELLLETRSALVSHGMEEAPLETELLLMKALGVDRPRLYSSPERLITLREREALAQDLARRLTGEPWPYICGFREFYGLDMEVCPGTFIPRPETELLVDLALELAATLRAGVPLRIADVGTGSGAIAVTLAVQLSHATVYATDVSQQALKMARLNCQRHRVEERVALLRGDLLDPVSGPVDIVVSNPPYIETSEIPHLPMEVRREPMGALDGGEDGLDVVRRLMLQTQRKLRRPGGLIVEISPTQGAAVRDLARDLLPEYEITLREDMAGRTRALLAILL